MTDVTVSEAELIDISKVTTGSIDGSGNFDVLMRAVTAHLSKEFKAQRITAADYSNIYLSMMQAVLGAATQFTVANTRTAADTNYTKARTLLALWQARIAEQQCLTEEAQTRLVDLSGQTEEAKRNAQRAQTDGDKLDPTSVLGAQVKLLEQQRDGLQRDAEQKAAQQLIDMVKVLASTGTLEGTTMANSGLTDRNTAEAVKILMQGAGMDYSG